MLFTIGLFILLLLKSKKESSLFVLAYDHSGVGWWGISLHISTHMVLSHVDLFDFISQHKEINDEIGGIDRVVSYILKREILKD